MKKITLLRPLIVYVLILFTLSGCSMLGKKADPLAEAKQTAYYTCDGCHGPQNIRVEFMSPKIIGQKKDYIAAKLRDFRDLKRLNPYMNGVVEGMSDQDIAALASYYSNYPQTKK